jgi:hypothetical protein
MPKICVQSPEIVAQGEINIRAVVNVTTKAKLDEITVQGACACDGPPILPDKIYDIDFVFLVDGSDSFEATKINDLRTHTLTQSGEKEKLSQFGEAMKWCADFVQSFESRRIGKATSTIVQFSGVKAMESQYEPDTDGDVIAGNDELKHYRVEYGPKLYEGEDDTLNGLHLIEALDGNSQLYLALQDMSSDKFISRLDELLPNGVENHVRKRILITITDEEWDVRNLKSSRSMNQSISSEHDDSIDETDLPERRISRRATGPSYLSQNHVSALAHKQYSDMFAIIVRPTKHVEALNEEFIEQQLCKGESANYFKVFADNFHKGMETARKQIANKIARW